MNTITIDTQTYRNAEAYAAKHSISVDRLVEISLKRLFSIEVEPTNVRPIGELHPTVQSLMGLARKKDLAEIKDINGRDAK